MTAIDELEILLRNVKDGYPDFIDCVIYNAEEDEDVLLDMLDFMRDNPDATSSDIIRYMDEIQGIEVPQRKSAD